MRAYGAEFDPCNNAPRHNQANAIVFVDHVLETSPFPVQSIRTDRGHEFQTKLVLVQIGLSER